MKESSNSFHRASKSELSIPLLTVLLAACSALAIVWLRTEIPDISDQRSIGNNLGFYLLININIVVVMVLSFLVLRNIVKLFLDRKKNILGSRLRTKLMVSFVGLSLIPTALLFVTAKGIVDNILDGWFSPQIVSTVDSAMGVARFHYEETSERLKNELKVVKSSLQGVPLNPNFLEKDGATAVRRLVDSKRAEFMLGELSIVNGEGRLLVRSLDSKLSEVLLPAIDSDLESKNIGKEKIVQAEQSLGGEFVRAYSKLEHQDLSEELYLVGTYHVPAELNLALSSLVNSFDDYRELQRNKRPLASSYLLTLVMVMLLIMVTAMWIGFYLARSLTGPIQKLAEGTEEIAQGNLDYQIQDVGDDELGFLVSSFNTMTSDLKQTTEELVSRRKYIETVVESVPVGVVTIDRQGEVNTYNRVAENILGRKLAEGMSLREILPGRSFDVVYQNLEQLYSSDIKSVTDNVTIELGETELHLQFSATLLSGEEGSPGAVILFDDMSELVRAQKMAAWREVAKRIAHEIKNPLTPIQLSAQRIRKKIGSGNEIAGEKGVSFSTQDVKLFSDGMDLIVKQVETLRGLVNEFSRFARMPSAVLKKGNLNLVIKEAVAQYSAAHSSIDFDLDLDQGLPKVNMDQEQFSRVLVNLFDNSVAAFEGSQQLQANSDVAGPVSLSIDIKTKFAPDSSMIMLTVGDNGPGIADSARDKIFDPYFTSKKEGTGLGLSIVNSIISDHGGVIHAGKSKKDGLEISISLPSLLSSEGGYL